jgi:hypothetical protein
VENCAGSQAARRFRGGEGHSLERVPFRPEGLEEFRRAGGSGQQGAEGQPAARQGSRLRQQVEQGRTRRRKGAHPGPSSTHWATSSRRSMGTCRVRVFPCSFRPAFILLTYAPADGGRTVLTAPRPSRYNSPFLTVARFVTVDVVGRLSGEISCTQSSAVAGNSIA